MPKPKAPKVTPGAQAQSAHLQGMPPSLNPAAWRELDWARAKKLESTSGRQRKNLDRKKKTGHNWDWMPTFPTPDTAVCSLEMGIRSKKSKSGKVWDVLSGTVSAYTDVEVVDVG